MWWLLPKTTEDPTDDPTERGRPAFWVAGESCERWLRLSLIVSLGVSLLGRSLCGKLRRGFDENYRRQTEGFCLFLVPPSVPPSIPPSVLLPCPRGNCFCVSESAGQLLVVVWEGNPRHQQDLAAGKTKKFCSADRTQVTVEPLKKSLSANGEHVESQGSGLRRGLRESLRHGLRWGLRGRLRGRQGQ